MNATLMAAAEFERLRAEYLAREARARALPVGPERIALERECVELLRRCREVAGLIMPAAMVEELYPAAKVDRLAVLAPGGD